MLERLADNRLGGLMFVARRLVEGLWPGRHVSSRFGAGQEFHDYRSYSPGDDLSEVDWKVYGRTDRYFVRRHQQMTDLHAYLMVDVSTSMDFAGLDRWGRAALGDATPRKLEYAKTLAAAIAFLMVRQSDRVGLGLYADKLVDHLPPAGAWPHLQRLIAKLEAALAVEGVGKLSASLAQAHGLLKRRGLVVLIGDLLDEPAELFDGLARFRHDRFEVIVFQVLTPQELDLAGLGDLRARLIDSETRASIGADVGQIERGYRELMGKHLESISRGCAARGIDYNLLRTDQSVVEALRRYLVRRTAMMP